MPSIGFKRAFVAPIKNLTKPHTIRVRRKNPIKPGDRLYMYFEMRQKTCEKIGEAVCSKVEEISIEVWDGTTLGIVGDVIISGRQLSLKQIDDLAKADGFENRTEFYRFFFDSSGKTFTGDLIHWTDFVPA